jgi:hypothetical protein
VNVHHCFELEALEYEGAENSHLLPLLRLEVLLSHHHRDPHHLQQIHPKIKDSVTTRCQHKSTIFICRKICFKSSKESGNTNFLLQFLYFNQGRLKTQYVVAFTDAREKF